MDGGWIRLESSCDRLIGLGRDSITARNPRGYYYGFYAMEYTNHRSYYSIRV